MAKPVSYNKRDNEKKKASKRLKKQQKKEERKNNPSDGFDDMIAYVDENGVITSTPPDTESKEVIDIESIAISTPKKEEVVEESVLKGRIEYFNTSKGFGFIKDLASTEKYFFHINNAPREIAEGDIVLFELERGSRGMNAVNITLSSR